MARMPAVRPAAGGRGIVAVVFLLLSVSVATAAAFDPDHDAHLTVFAVVPARAAATVELSVLRFEVEAHDETLRVEPWRDRLSTETDGGYARTWMRTAIPAGRVDSLRVVVDRARVRVGGVWTEVDLRDVPIRLPIRRDLAPGECLVVHVEFDPDATPVDAADWRPVFRLRQPDPPPLGQRVFVALEDGGTLAVLDRRSGRVVQEIGVGGRPTDLVYSTLERRLFITVAGRDELVAVDLGDVDRIRRLPLRPGDEPVRVLLSDDQFDVFVLARGHDALVRVTNQTFQESSRIALAPRPVAMTVDPRSGRLFVSSEASRAVEVVDPRENQVVERFGVRDVPGEMVFLEDAGELLVASRDARSLERLDARSGSAIDAIELCGPVRGLAAQRRSDRVFALLALCDELSVLRPRLELEIATLPLPGSPGRARLDAEERMLLVPMPEDDVLLEINTSRIREFVEREVGPRPVAVIVP